MCVCVCTVRAVLHKNSVHASDLAQKANKPNNSAGISCASVCMCVRESIWHVYVWVLCVCIETETNTKIAEVISKRTHGILATVNGTTAAAAANWHWLLRQHTTLARLSNDDNGVFAFLHVSLVCLFTEGPLRHAKQRCCRSMRACLPVCVCVCVSELECVSSCWQQRITYVAC